MVIGVLAQLFERDLVRLAQEIAQYRTDTALWKHVDGIANPGGNLCLHLAGNLNTYVGRVLGGIAYERDRDREFSATGIPKAVLLEQVHDTRRRVAATLAQLDPANLEQEFPMAVFETPCSTGFLLMHLSTHLAYHLGQVNYHRRMVDGQAGAPVLASAVPKLPMRDPEVTRRFYTRQLGFTETGFYGDYLTLRRQGVELHFFLHRTLVPSENDGQVYLRVRDVAGFYREVQAAGTSIHPNGPLAVKPWGQQEFSVLDPDFNLLTFGEPAA